MAERRNLSEFPNFEGSLVWETAGTSTVTIQTTEVHDGTHALKVVLGNVVNSGAAGEISQSVTGSKTFTVSTWIKIPTGTTVNPILQEYTAGFAGFLENHFPSSIVGNGAWQRFSYTLTTKPTAGAFGLIFEVAVASTATFYVDSILVEEGSETLTYFDGGTTLSGYTCSWEGAANASVSKAVEVTAAQPLLSMVI